MTEGRNVHSNLDTSARLFLQRASRSRKHLPRSSRDRQRIHAGPRHSASFNGAKGRAPHQPLPIRSSKTGSMIPFRFLPGQAGSGGTIIEMAVKHTYRSMLDASHLEDVYWADCLRASPCHWTHDWRPRRYYMHLS